MTVASKTAAAPPIVSVSDVPAATKSAAVAFAYLWDALSTVESMEPAALKLLVTELRAVETKHASRSQNEGDRDHTQAAIWCAIADFALDSIVEF